MGELTTTRHVVTVSTICWYHLRRLRQLHNYVDRDVIARLVLLRIDYCNAVIAGPPASSPTPLQRLPNAAARLVLGLDRRTHMTPALKRLYWFSVKYRALFKLATLMHRGLHRCCPAYATDIVTLNDSDTVVLCLRPSTTRAAIMKPTRTQFSRRAFSVAGPDIWNSLPPEIRLTENCYWFCLICITLLISVTHGLL